MNELTQEETVQFLKVISDSCRYDYIFLDLKSDLSQESRFLMSLCRIIILVQNDDPVSRFKNRKLDAYMNMTDREKINGRFILAVNKSNGFEAETEDSESGGFKNLKRIHIERDENSFQYAWNHLNIDITHAFGIGIKKIADDILLSGKEREICTGNSAP